MMIPQRKASVSLSPFRPLIEVKKPVWLVYFIDLITLMLAFFIMMYAMRIPDPRPFQTSETQAHLSGQTVAGGIQQYSAQAQQTIMRIDRQDGLNLSYLAGLLRREFEDLPAATRPQVLQLSDRLVVTLPSDLLFAPGRAALKRGSISALKRLTSRLSRVGNAVAVYGHTDPRPVRGELTSNWALSLARATAVAAAMTGNGYNRSLDVKGLAASRYEELPDNWSREMRMDMARRVDIVIMAEQ